MLFVDWNRHEVKLIISYTYRTWDFDIDSVAHLNQYIQHKFELMVILKAMVLLL